MSTSLKIDFVSDVSCPWCVIGLRGLTEALDQLGAEVQALFARVRTPIVAANALDDHWAPPASRDAFMAGYSHAGWRALDIDPAGPVGPIGHMGYFRRQAQPLWENALQWFAEHPALSHPSHNHVTQSSAS